MTMNPFLPVAKVPLLTGGGDVSSRCAVVLDPEGEAQEVGVVSADYALVPNQKVHDLAVEVLERSGLATEPVRTLCDGKRYQQSWRMTDVTVAAQLGDVIALTVEAFNSYNGSMNFGLAFNAQRLVCENGMTLDFMLGGFRFRHYGQRDFDRELEGATDAILALTDKVKLLEPVLSKMVNTKVTRPELQAIYGSLPLGQGLIAQSFLGIEEDTQWGVYNAITDVLTRQESFRAHEINRQVSRHFMGRAA